MRVGNCAFVLRMELNTNEERMILNLNDLNQSFFWVDTGRHHAVVFEFVDIIIVKFESMAMTFRNVSTPVDTVSERIRLNRTWIRT